MRCDVIITLGDQLRDAAASAAAHSTTTHLLVINARPVNAPGVTNLTPTQTDSVSLSHALADAF
jgi:hypothetical protein